MLISARTTGREIEMVVQDSAPGVGDEHLPQLFERFYRVDKSRSGGSGLGLAICKIIVENHSGSISAEHSTLGGLLIHIKLPTITGGEIING